MTCIVALVDSGRVWIGGDSAGSSGWDLTLRRDPKVFARDGMLFGFTTSFRMGQLLQYKLEVPDRPAKMPAMTFMCGPFIDAVRTTFQQGGWAKIESNREEAGQFIVAFDRHLFTVWGDYQVATSRDPFMAAGCGAPYTLGSLLTSPVGAHPRYRVRKALEVAAHCSAGVAGPFTILEGS